MSNESQETQTKIKCSDKNNITCNLFVSLCVLNIYLIECHLSIASKHIAKFFKISSHNVAIFIVKLYSSFSLSSAIGSGIEFFVDHLILDNFLNANIGISASISLSRFLFVIFSYRPPSLIFFYILINFDALITGLYKMLIFVNFPSYAATCVFSRDVSAFSISLLQAVLDICIGRSPSTLRIEYFFFLCTSFSTLKFLTDTDRDFKNSYTDPITDINKIISNLCSNSDLQSEIDGLDTIVQEIIKIMKLERMKKYMKPVSVSIVKIQEIEVIETLKGLENLINEIKTEEIKKTVERGFMNFFIETLKMLKNKLSQKPTEPKNEKKNEQTSNPKNSVKENLEELYPKLIPLLKQVKQMTNIIQNIRIIYYEDIQTYPSEINKLTAISANIIKLEEKLQNLVEKSNFKRLEEIFEQILILLGTINKSKGKDSSDEINMIQIYKNQLEEVRDINKEIHNVIQIIKEINSEIQKNPTTIQIQKVESKIKEIKRSLNDNIKTETNKPITLNYAKSEKINTLESKKVELTQKNYLSIINNELKYIKLSEIDNLKELLINYKKNYIISKFLDFLIPILEKKCNISSKKRSILDDLSNINLKSKSNTSNKKIQEIKILKNSLKILESQKKSFDHVIEVMDHENINLKKISEVPQGNAGQMTHQLGGLNLSITKSELTTVESTLKTIKPLGLNLLPTELSNMISYLNNIEASLPSARNNSLSHLTQIENSIRNIRRINVQNIREKFNQIMQIKDKTIEKLEEIDIIITKIEVNDIEELVKFKWNLGPEKLQLGDMLQSFISLPGVQNIKKLVEELTPILTSIQSLEIMTKLDFIEDIVISITYGKEYDIPEISKIKQLETEINKLYSKYKYPVDKHEQLIQLEKNIDKNEKQIPQELKKLGLLEDISEGANKISTKLQVFKTKLENNITKFSSILNIILSDIQNAKVKLPSIIEEINSSTIHKYFQNDDQLDNFSNTFKETCNVLERIDFIKADIKHIISNINIQISSTSSSIRTLKRRKMPSDLTNLKEQGKKINTSQLTEIYDTIQFLHSKSILNKIDRAKEVLTSLEREMNIEQLLKLKVQLDPTKLDLEEDFKYIIKSKEETSLLTNISKVKKQLESLKKLADDKSKKIDALKQYEKLKKEKEAEEKYNILKEIKNREQVQLKELQQAKVKVEELKQKKKQEITVQSEQLKTTIEEIQTKIHKFGPINHILNTISQFTIATTTTSITNVVHPGVLPLAIVEISDCELINLYTPLFYVIGSGAIFCIDYFFQNVLNEWEWYCNLVWILLVPQLVIMILSFVTVHTKSKCSEQIRNSKVRIFLMLSFLLVSYSLMESMSYVSVANYVVYKSKYFKSSIDVIRYFLILISIIKFLTYKLSVGYNIVRVKHGYVAPKFEPYDSDKKPNSCYLFLDVLLRSLIDIFLDFKLNIRDYT